MRGAKLWKVLVTKEKVYSPIVLQETREFSLLTAIRDLFDIHQDLSVIMRFNQFLTSTKANPFFKQVAILERYLADEEHIKHATTVAFISYLLAIKSGFKTDRDLKTLFLASFFHDVGLFDLLPHVKEEEISSLASEDIEKFLLHPQRSVEILSPIGVFTNEALIAIRQHHMRVIGNSFPYKFKSETLGPFGQFIGLADRILHLLKEHRPVSNSDMKKIKKMIVFKVFPSFNSQVTAELMPTFSIN
jgi:HD-GYP domain-containing protein (c-di-GMP phosphodiesterase class II)